MEEPPADPPTFVDMRIDGEPTLVADAIELDIRGEFDRRQTGNADDVKRIALAVLRTVFARLRCFGRAFFMRFESDRVTWRLRYLSDAGEELEQQEGLVRGRGAASVAVPPLMWIAPEYWAALATLATAPPAPPSDELFLDALAALPHVGAAVVLAHTAIEVRIASALNVLATNNPAIVAGPMWTWIIDRAKEPSVEEQLCDLMLILAGRSLKTETLLWGGYRELRKARNSFVHEGRAVLLDQTPVDAIKAHELVHVAANVIEWIESALPVADRRPDVATPARVMQRMIPLIST